MKILGSRVEDTGVGRAEAVVFMERIEGEAGRGGIVEE